MFDNNDNFDKYNIFSIMNGFDLSTISGLYVGSTEYTSIYKGSTLIWTKTIDYSREYLTIESLEDNNFINFQTNDSSLFRTIEVSTNKTNWISYTSSTSGTTLAILNKGDKLYVRGSNNYYGGSTVYNYFTSTKQFNVYGNIMSLIYGDNFINKTFLPSGYIFHSLFKNCTTLVDISNLILPATTLQSYCYMNMFYGCSSLTTAPNILPATTLATDCYRSMFDRCSSLTTAPELPATGLDSNCYRSMFYNCTSLTTAPELPATTLSTGCYMNMFYGCSSLTTAPSLHATRLGQQCYYSMFYNCTSLTTAPELPATTLATECYRSMFQYCSSLTTAPELKATTMYVNCYRSMFQGCSSLTTAPELPATTLNTYCYYYMFYGCRSLNYIKALFTTNISSTTLYTSNWLTNVAATGTFVKSKDATWSRTDGSGIPSGWTVTTI